MDEVPGPEPLPGTEEPPVAEYQAAPIEPALPDTPPLGGVPVLLLRTAPWAYLLAIVGFLGSCCFPGWRARPTFEKQ